MGQWLSLCTSALSERERDRERERMQKIMHEAEEKHMSDSKQPRVSENICTHHKWRGRRQDNSRVAESSFFPCEITQPHVQRVIAYHRW